jgi:hypothetical protein
MSLLKPLVQGQGYLKAGFQGFAGSGKTFTATDLAIGVREHMKLKGPIAFFDTEGGSTYIQTKVKEKTGMDLVGMRSRAFVDLINLTREAEQAGVSVLIVDSITHVWDELQKAHLSRVNEILRDRKKGPRYNLEFQDWAPIKAKWGEWTTLFLNSKLHIVFCGRAGFSYDHEVNQETGKKELIKTGTKMKAENEFGYEPSLLIEMESIKVRNKKGVVNHQATVLKDRWDVLNGKEFMNPTFQTFLPHIELLSPGSHAPIDTDIKTEPLVSEDGASDSKIRSILTQEITGELKNMYPGSTEAARSAREKLFHEVFNTWSWDAVELMAPDKLRIGLAAIRSRRPQQQQEAQNVPS